MAQSLSIRTLRISDANQTYRVKAELGLNLPVQDRADLDW
jgi:hypothetical protein